MKKRFTETQIVGFLREADAGLTVKDLCRKHGFSEASYYLWRSKFGGMSVPDARRLKELEIENGRLKKLLADALLENEVTREVFAEKVVTAVLRQNRCGSCARLPAALSHRRDEHDSRNRRPLDRAAPCRCGPTRPAARIRTPAHVRLRVVRSDGVSPPTSGKATTSPSVIACTGRGVGASFSRERCVRAP